MKEYLLLFRGANTRGIEQPPGQIQAHMQRWMEWMGDLQQKDQLVSAQPLSRSGKQITGVNKTITDGPFVEGKEMVGGYLMCKAGNYDSAVEIAKGCPILEFEDGKVEVREIQEMKI